MANGQVMNQGRQIMMSCFLPSFITFVLFFIVILPLRGFSGDHTGPPSLTPSPPTAVASSGPLYPTWWSGSPRIHQGVRCKNPGKCVECHEETATMDSSHALPCVQCHRGNPKAEDEDAAHTGLIKDPGDLRYVDITCGKCHPEKARRVKRSPMALAPRMINHTRFAFGAQESPEVRFGTRALQAIKQVPSRSESTSIGDDLLRRSCLRCHLHTRGATRWGEHRGKGCSACHVPYPNSGDGRPRKHTLVRTTGINACLKCHNSNHVGGDYVGLFEKDFHRGFQSPFVKGRQPTAIYGSEQHRLSSDVHFRAGMICADCHTLDEIHGTGEVPKSAFNGVKISCEGCHVRGDHPAILKMPDGKMTLLRGEGRTVPPWDPNIVPHSVGTHRERLECSACHAAWSFQDYGFHLMLEERADYWKWATTAMQNDPQVQDLLRTETGTVADFLPPKGGSVPPRPQNTWALPIARDWLDGKKEKGAWFRGYTMRRWAGPPLGRNHLGKISIMRPMYQYVISHVDADDNLLLDRMIPTTGSGVPALLFNPYTPHTTASQGRACHECHGSLKAAGLGNAVPGREKERSQPIMQRESHIPGYDFRWDALVDRDGKALQHSTHPSAGPLDEKTLKRLLSPSDRHRALWHEYLNRRMRTDNEPGKSVN
jgi:hypothetical protein